MLKTKKHGGFRPGAGRPKIDNPRKQRMLKFTDKEWETVLALSTEKKMNAREFLSYLIEQARMKNERISS